MTDPILVLCMGRSGSSLTAGILAAHGVWTGACMEPDHRNPRGYFENKRLKRMLVSMAGRQVTKVYEPVAGWRAQVESVLRAEGYKGGPWLVKHSVIFHRLWECFESPTFILPRRGSEAIFRSVRKAGFHKWQSDEQLHATIELHQRTLDSIRDERCGVDVDVDAVVRGDYTTLQAAAERCGLKFDPSAADSFVDPRHWHEGAA